MNNQNYLLLHYHPSPIALSPAYQLFARIFSSRRTSITRLVFTPFILHSLHNTNLKGEQFCLKYDANSLIYISKAMDLFDMTLPALQELNLTSSQPSAPPSTDSSFTPTHTTHSKSHPPPVNPPAHLTDLAEGLAPLKNIPTLVLGVQSDILFTVEQQRELADALRMAGNERVSYYELGGVWGHDTFL